MPCRTGTFAYQHPITDGTSRSIQASFCLLVLLIGIVLSFVGDLIGIVSKNPEATTHILLLPQLILGMLSVGILPPEQFPGWLQAFVRNQFYSQFVNALRALAGNATNSVPWPTWSV